LTRRGRLVPFAQRGRGWKGLLVMAIAGVAAALGIVSSGMAGPGSAEATGPAVVVQEGRYVYAIALDGSRTVRLASIPRLSAPAVSPDGSKIAYVREGGISVMRADGTQRTFVTRGRDAGPAWSPDGRTLYFTRTQGVPGNWTPGALPLSGSIFSVSAKGGAPRRVTDASQTGRCHEDPAVSPDGSRVAFSDWDACDGGTSRPRLRVVDRQGTETGDLRFLPRNSGDGNDPELATPTWSPDGKRLAFCNNHHLWVADRDGSRARRVISDVCVWHGDSPLWSRDGSWIASAKRLPDGRTAFFIVHPDGTSFRGLRTTNADNLSLAGWLPTLPK
jgi:Tol biopolymer transport system component